MIVPLVREIVDWDEYPGRLHPVNSVEIRSRVSGYLESIDFEDGEIVEKGDLLFVIDSRPFRADLDGAQAGLARAKAAADLAVREHERATRLSKNGVISKEQLDQRSTSLQEANAALQSSRAAVESARLALEFTQIAAPIRGRASARAVDVGNLVSGGTANSTLLTTIVSLDPIYCVFDADEREVLKYIRMGRSGERTSGRETDHPVLLGLADEEGFPHRGKLDFIDNRLDSSTGTMRARAVFANPDHLLIPGMFGRIRIAGSGRYRGALVPDRALQTDQSRQFIYVVGKEGEAELREIQAGPRLGDLRIVRKGVDASDRVVVSGLHRLGPGTKVEATTIAFAADEDLFAYVDLLAPPGGASGASSPE